MENQLKRANEQLDELKTERDHLEQQCAQGDKNKKTLQQKLTEVEDEMESLESDRQLLDRKRKEKRR